MKPNKHRTAQPETALERIAKAQASAAVKVALIREWSPWLKVQLEQLPGLVRRLWDLWQAS